MAAIGVDRLLREAQVAEITGFSVYTLQGWRSSSREDKGPPWRKIGRSVVYPLSEVRSWMAGLIGPEDDAETGSIKAG